jgi:hypothetical protein
MDNQGFKFLSIGNSTVVFYNKMTKESDNVGKSINSRQNLTKSYKSKHLTPKSKKQINKIVFHWSMCVEQIKEAKKKNNKIKRRSLAMITLTLPAKQILSDSECNKQYLSPFLNRLKKIRPNIHYLWVCEKQKNGNIHYHLIVDLFVEKTWIREVWNSILSGKPEMEQFYKKFNRRNPPSTEVDTLKKIHSAGAYITKYITKLDDKFDLECKKWDCDSDLLKLSTICLSSKYWYIEEFAHYRKYFQIEKYQKDYFQIFTFNSHFHQSFKFLNVYHDLLPQLLYYYSDVYAELKIPEKPILPQPKIIRPPQVIQANLDF